MARRHRRSPPPLLRWMTTTPRPRIYSRAWCDVVLVRFDRAGLGRAGVGIASSGAREEGTVSCPLSIRRQPPWTKLGHMSSMIALLPVAFGSAHQCGNHATQMQSRVVAVAMPCLTLWQIEARHTFHAFDGMPAAVFADPIRFRVAEISGGG